MRLESVDEIRAQGVTVYDYRTQEEKAQPLDVSAFDVPKWAKWIAADKAGHVYPYCTEPVCGNYSWICHESEIYINNASNKIDTINMTGIDWRRTLTAVNVGLHATDARGILQSQEVPAVNVEQQPAQPWCEQCGLPEDICRGHDAPAQCDRGNAALVAVEAAGSVLKGFFGGGPSDVGQQVVAAPSLPVETIVALWQQLDGMQECDLAAAMVRAEARRADGFFTTLGMALDAVQSPQYNSDADMAPAKQQTQEVPAAQISIHAAALPGDVAEALFAQHSASWCERLIDELLAVLMVPGALDDFALMVREFGRRVEYVTLRYERTGKFDEGMTATITWIPIAMAAPHGRRLLVTVVCADYATVRDAWYQVGPDVSHLLIDEHWMLCDSPEHMRALRNDARVTAWAEIPAPYTEVQP